jgi:hypothetical protein
MKKIAVHVRRRRPALLSNNGPEQLAAAGGRTPDLHFLSGTVQFNVVGIPRNQLGPLEEVAKLSAVA